MATCRSSLCLSFFLLTLVVYRIMRTLAKYPLWSAYCTGIDALKLFSMVWVLTKDRTTMAYVSDTDRQRLFFIYEIISR